MESVEKSGAARGRAQAVSIAGVQLHPGSRKLYTAWTFVYAILSIRSSSQLQQLLDS